MINTGGSARRTALYLYSDLYDWQRGILEALPVSAYNGFVLKSDREYTKGMRDAVILIGIVRSGMSDLHGSL